MRSFRSLAWLAACVGCASSQSDREVAAVPPAGPAAQASAPSTSASSVAAPVPSTRSSLVLEPLPAPLVLLPAPRIELQRPAMGEVIEAAEARTYEVRLDVGGYFLTDTGQGALIALDGERPRRWPSGKSLRLVDLIPEDRELGAGRHTLVVVLVDAEGRVLRGKAKNGQSPFFTVDFFVGRRETLPDARAPELFCLSPFGTVYGPGERDLRLELLATRAIDRARVRFSGAVDFATEIDPSLAYAIRGVPPGDLRITAEAAGGAGVGGCVVTVNPAMTPRKP